MKGVEYGSKEREIGKKSEEGRSKEWEEVNNEKKMKKKGSK